MLRWFRFNLINSGQGPVSFEQLQIQLSVAFFNASQVFQIIKMDLIIYACNKDSQT